MTDERVTYITQLESRIDELKHVIRDAEDDLAATITAQARRIAELTDALERKNGALHALDGIANQLAETVQRLEQDNKRLRHLDSMPVDALRRYHLFTHYDVHAANDVGYTTQQFDSDDEDIRLWLTSLDGDA